MTKKAKTPAVINREDWLTRAIEIFRPRFVEVGHPLPEKVRISVGFSKGAHAENGQVLGTCYSRACTEDGVNEIFVTPEDADTTSMLETVLHELIHATLDCQDGHRGRFAEIATRLGFNGPMTATPSTPELAAELITIAAAIGEYPGAKMNLESAKVPAPVGPDGNPIPGWMPPPISSAGPGQKNRQRLAICRVDPFASCWEYKVRGSNRTFETVGLPYCPNGHRMIRGD